MNVKGTAYITRKDTIIKNFGEERWNTFMRQTGGEGQIF